MTQQDADKMKEWVESLDIDQLAKLYRWIFTHYFYRLSLWRRVP